MCGGALYHAAFQQHQLCGNQLRFQFRGQRHHAALFYAKAVRGLQHPIVHLYPALALQQSATHCLNFLCLHTAGGKCFLLCGGHQGGAGHFAVFQLGQQGGAFRRQGQPAIHIQFVALAADQRGGQFGIILEVGCSVRHNFQVGIILKQRGGLCGKALGQNCPGRIEPHALLCQGSDIQRGVQHHNTAGRPVQGRFGPQGKSAVQHGGVFQLHCTVRPGDDLPVHCHITQLSAQAARAVYLPVYRNLQIPRQHFGRAGSNFQFAVHRQHCVCFGYIAGGDLRHAVHTAQGNIRVVRCQITF